jgi:hypothetical protein
MARLLQRGRDNTAAFQILEAYLLLQVSQGGFVQQQQQQQQ